MEALTYTHAYATYEQTEGIEYETPELKQKSSTSLWLKLASLAMMLTSMGLAIPASAALYVKTNGSCLNARTGPSVGHRKVKCVRNGAKLLPVIGHGYDNAKNKWYQLSSGRWVMAKYTQDKATTNPKPNPNPDNGSTGGNIGGSETTLSIGSQGARVAELQRHLDLNYYNVDVNGFYDRNTSLAVSLYQKDNDLAVDGVAGTATLRHMGLI